MGTTRSLVKSFFDLLILRVGFLMIASSLSRDNEKLRNKPRSVLICPAIWVTSIKDRFDSTFTFDD